MTQQRSMVLNRAFGLDQDLDADQLEQEILDHFNKANEEAQWRASAVGYQLNPNERAHTLPLQTWYERRAFSHSFLRNGNFFAALSQPINESTLIPEAWIRESNILK